MQSGEDVVRQLQGMIRAESGGRFDEYRDFDVGSFREGCVGLGGERRGKVLDALPVERVDDDLVATEPGP